jgi:mercuric reductase
MNRNDTRTHDYDLLVIGSGGGAMAAAIRGRDLGHSVLLVEEGTIGGTCVNTGCIPSKALLVASERRDGPLAEAVTVKAALVERLRRSKYVDLLDEHEIERRLGHAELLDAHTVAVDGEQVSAGAIVLAAGARPAVPPIPGLEEAGYLTSTSAMELLEPPRRLAVIGANAVGLELGQMLGNFGSEVTFISRRAIAPHSEPEVSQAIRGVLADQGHRTLEHAQTESVGIEGSEKVIRGPLAGDQQFEVRADEVLVATGRTPNTEVLGLAEVGVETDESGRIVVDEHQRTSVPSIYAAGDVTTQPQYVYVAAAAGAAAAQNALSGGDERLDFAALPRIIFTKPQIAAAGVTEAQAVDAGFEVETALLPLEAVPRALVNGDTRGLVKLVAEARTRRLIGASVIADGAGDVIQAAVLAIDQGLSADRLASVWAPYPTMAEGLKLAAQTFDRDVAALSCCAA